MRFLIRFFALVIFLIPAAALSQQETIPTIEILSKDDARSLFSMTEEQWRANVRQSVAAGIAQAMGSAGRGCRMSGATG